jgi:ParB-like chromosome segregation protein Spo0J
MIPILTVQGYNYELPYHDLLPPLSPALFTELKADILEKGGNIYPVIYCPTLQGTRRVIDGGHRVRAVFELRDEGHQVELNADLYETSTLDEEKQLALDLNTKRRQLTAEERAALVVRLKQEGMSKRAIADRIGVDEKTVRNDLKASGAECSAPEKVTGKDGKSYSAKATPKEPTPEPQEAPRSSLSISTPLESSQRVTSVYDAAEATQAKELTCVGCQRIRPRRVFSWFSNRLLCDECREIAMHPPKAAPTETPAPLPAPQLPPVVVDIVEPKKGAPAIAASGFDGWNTPPHIIALVKSFGLDGISLDPCSNEHSQVGARIELYKDGNGLNQNWVGLLHTIDRDGGLIFVNPPYDFETLAQVNNHCTQQAGMGAEIIALVPAKVDQSWFQDGAFEDASALCFIKGRVPFWKDGAPAQGSAFACLLIYWGKDSAAFVEMFSALGACLDLELQREAAAERAEKEGLP